MTRLGSEVMRPPSNVSKPGRASRLVARDVIDPKCDDVSKVPKPLHVCIQVMPAEVWQRIDGKMSDSKCSNTGVCNVWLLMRFKRVGHLC